MIKTFIHGIKDINQRDKDINAFVMDNKVFATQSNINNEKILTTIFYESKSK